MILRMRSPENVWSVMMCLDEDGPRRGAYRGNEGSHRQGVDASVFGGLKPSTDVPFGIWDKHILMVCM